MRIRTAADLLRLQDHDIPESPSLEYKRQLDVDTKPHKAEVLKDLTGMANGGGGCVLYGMDERPGEWPSAGEITPMNDRGLVSRLEDIVHSGVAPPLLVDYYTIEVEGGFALAVEVAPSPLGPYMVQSPKAGSYHRRAGSRTVPMSEREVRDAYALASRSADRRPELWERHSLPLAHTSNPALVVSALPEEPLPRVFDMAVITAADLQPPPGLNLYLNDRHCTFLTPTLARLAPWIDGFHASDHQGREIRLHADGAAGIAVSIDTVQYDTGEQVASPTQISRVLNGALLYLGWLWSTFGLMRPVELRVDLYAASDQVFETGNEPIPATSTIQLPHGVRPVTQYVSEYVTSSELIRASVRHRIVARFADRLHQALGEASAMVPFRRGLLHDRDGQPIEATLSRRAVVGETGSRTAIGWLYADGALCSTADARVHVGWYDDGVIIDRNGDTLAVTELATGSGCPDDFVAMRTGDTPRALGDRTVEPEVSQVPHGPRPNATRRWSEQDLVQRLERPDR